MSGCVERNFTFAGLFRALRSMLAGACRCYVAGTVGCGVHSDLMTMMCMRYHRETSHGSSLTFQRISRRLETAGAGRSTENFHTRQLITEAECGATDLYNSETTSLSFVDCVPVSISPLVFFFPRIYPLPLSASGTHDQSFLQCP